MPHITFALVETRFGSLSPVEIPVREIRSPHGFSPVESVFIRLDPEQIRRSADFGSVKTDEGHYMITGGYWFVQNSLFDTSRFKQLLCVGERVERNHIRSTLHILKSLCRAEHCSFSFTPNMDQNTAKAKLRFSYGNSHRAHVLSGCIKLHLRFVRPVDSPQQSRRPTYDPVQPSMSGTDVGSPPAFGRRQRPRRS